MKKKALFLGAAILVGCQTYPAVGNLFEVSVSTDKPTYLLGEDIGFSVTVFNPNDYEISILDLIGYNIDNFGWLSFPGEDPGPIPMPIPIGPRPIPPLSNYTWYHTHLYDTYLPLPGIHPPELYPHLEVGVHSFVGMAAEYITTPPYTYLQSEPFQFSVVPEPATFVLLGTAGIWIFTRKQRFLGGNRNK